MMKNLMKIFVNYFLQGLLYVVPISVTIYILYWVIHQIDNLFQLSFPGLGILILLIGVTAIGVLGSFIIELPLFGIFNKLLNKAPLVKLIYSSIKDLVNAFVGKKKSFNKPVLVKLYENSEIRRLGFITNETSDLLDGKVDLVTVYIPHSFAISGQLYLMPASYIQEIDGKSTEIMKYIVAGGVTKVDEH